MQRDVLGSAMRVMEHLSRSRDPVGVREVSRDLGLAVASTHRILRALCRERLAVQVGERGLYSSGARLAELAANLGNAEDVVPRAMPLLRAAAAGSGESALLMVAQRHESVCLASVESEQFLRVVFPVGWRGPLYRGATGRVLLAYQPPEVIEAVIARGRREPAARRLADSAELLRSLARIRRQGHCVSHGERQEGWTSVAAPVLGPRRVVVAAVSIYGPSPRFERAALQEHTRRVLACAANIESALHPGIPYHKGVRHELEGS